MYRLSCLSKAPTIGVLMLLPLAFGCGQSPDSTAASSSPSSGSERESLQHGPQLESDQSLGTSEYVDMGLPSPDQVWAGADMIKANEVLAACTGKLPRYTSPRSGTVFARITSTESFTRFRSKDIPLQTRFSDTLDYGDGLKEIWKKYALAFQSNSVTDSDLVEIIGAYLRFVAVQLDLSDEFMATIDKNDPSYASRMQGRELVKLGLHQMVTGLLITLSERQRFRDTELVRLMNYMQATVPAIALRMSPHGRTEIITRLRQMHDNPAMKELRQNLRGLLKEMERASEQKSSTLEMTRNGDLEKNGIGSSGEPNMKMHRLGAGEIDETGWCHATSTEGGFSVLLPNVFNDFTITAKATDGIEAKTCVVGTTDERLVKYAAFAMSRSDGTFKGDPLEGITDGFEKRGVLKEKKFIKLGELKGVEARVESHISSAILRVYKSPRTTYHLIVEAPSSIKLADVEIDVKRFMDSFAISETFQK